MEDGQEYDSSSENTMYDAKVDVATQQVVNKNEVSAAYNLFSQNEDVLVKEGTEDVAANDYLPREDDVKSDQPSPQYLGYYPMPRLEFMKF